MGRTTESKGLAPSNVRKDMRAKEAKRIVNTVIPAILASNARARRGVEGSTLITDPARVQNDPVFQVTENDATQYVRRKGQGRRKRKDHGRDLDASVEHEGRESMDTPLPSPTAATQELWIRIINTDTLTAASMLSCQKEDDHPGKKKKRPNVCVLNMASPLRPGGGVLQGASAQEEFLSTRTTLLPSLKEEYYRLPEVGAIYSKDVLVFRDTSPLLDSAELALDKRIWVNVISAGMLRFPELEGEEEEPKKWSIKDRELVEKKMRAVLRIASQNNTKDLVLGAWGCGAYGNPVGEVARAWKRLLSPKEAVSKMGSTSETWEPIENIIFAISNRKMAEEFGKAFDESIEIEDMDEANESEIDEEPDTAFKELQKQIQEMKTRIEMTRIPDLKAGLQRILDGLQQKLSDMSADGDTISDEADD